MSHPLTACISEIELLQERIAEKNDRIEALEAALMAEWAARDNHIEALEAAHEQDTRLIKEFTTAIKLAADRIEALEAALHRCRTVLGNMALEYEGAIFNRWPINHEPLRNDARNLLPVIDAALAPETEK